MKGIVSEAMLLCAINGEKVELLTPPSISKIGDKIKVTGYSGEPVKEVNNKILATILPDFKTNDDCVATYKGSALSVQNEAGTGVVTCLSLKNTKIK